jgi:amino acid adenylation domain-containing protein
VDDAETVLGLIAHQAAQAPEKIAVTCAGRALTYRQLEERAENIAAELRHHGAAPDSVVAVLLERSAELVVTLLGVLKAGCAYLALNPDDPQPRLDDLMRDAGARFVVVHRDLAGRAPAAAIVLDPAGSPRRSGTARPPVTAGQLAYVSYTSGSTGRPKGVAVPHRGIVRLVRDPNWMRISSDDVFLQVAPVAFDFSTLEIFGALANGCRLAVLPGGGPVDLDAIIETVRREQVTVLMLTTGLLHQLISTALPCFAGVRHVVAGGDVASVGLTRRLLGAHPGLLFTNGYGPTENTTFTTCWTTDEPPTSETVPIGTAINGTEVVLLDPRLERVPDGDAGELCTSGLGLARGYLGRPAETAERFVPSPYGPPGSRMYRTGDLARRRPDGSIAFIGRTDDQVKIQGFRVEPAMVESALGRMPGVSQAAVVAQGDDPAHRRLVAYVVPEEPDGAADLGRRLRDRLRAEQPAYLVPWAILVRGDLPLNRNGKVDRPALPAVGRAARSLSTDFVPPAAGLQQRIADLWGELLDVEPVGIEDDFFDLGGHSLLATELLVALQRELGVDVPARTLYLQPTVAALSAAVRELSGDAPPARTRTGGVAR